MEKMGIKEFRKFIWSQLPKSDDETVENIINNRHLATPKAFWSMVGERWTANHFVTYTMMDLLIDAEDDERRLMMDKQELAFFDSLEDCMEIYRGGDDEGFCWTTDLDVAIGFGRRHRTGHVYRATLDKEEVIATFLRRGESEIVLSSTPYDVELFFVEELAKAA